MGGNVYTKFSLGNNAGSCQDISICKHIPKVVGNPNRTVHITSFLKALTTNTVFSLNLR